MSAAGGRGGLIRYVRLEEFILLCAFTIVSVLSVGLTGEFRFGRAGRIGNMLALICSCFVLGVGLHDIVTAPREMGSTRLALRILRKTAGLLRDWLPLYFALSMYTYLYGLVHLINPYDMDSLLLAADRFLFGETPALSLQYWCRTWLTEAVSLAYVSMMLFPPVFLLCLHLRGDRRAFRSATVGLMLLCLLGYLGYVAVPAVGPSVYLEKSFTRDLAGGVISRMGRDLIALGRNPRDCFPSMHVAIPMLMLLFARNSCRAFVVPGLPLFLAIVFSTMYLRYHYAVDLAAGALLAFFVHRATGPLQRWWERMGGDAYD